MADITPVLIRTDDHAGVFNVGTDFSSPVGEVFEGDCRDCFPAFSADTKLAAVASTEKVAVLDTSSGKVLGEFSEPRVVHLAFSPNQKFLVTMSHPDAKQEAGNLAVFSMKDFSEKLRVVQSQWPAFEWCTDESYAVRSAAGLLMVHNGELESGEALQKLDLQLPRTKEYSMAMCPSEQPLMALFKPHNKQTQASCAIYRLPNIKMGEDLFSIPFGRADDATLSWSPSGSAVTVVVKKETDKSGKSYYGTSALVLLRIRDRSSVNVNTFNETVHDCRWSPVADEFLVIHGAMPRNRATLYNGDGVAIFTIGEAPRNVIHWAPNGKFFSLGGIGNLAGEFQFFNRDDAKGKASSTTATQIGSFTEKSSLQQWSPCSRYFLCSTVFSRLRVDNKLVLWKHNGERVADKKFGELHSADFIPLSHKDFKPRAPSPMKKAEAPPKPKAYVPPRRSEGAAALLSRAPAGTAAKVKPSGPVGACVVEEPKKKKGKKR